MVTVCPATKNVTAEEIKRIPTEEDVETPGKTIPEERSEVCPISPIPSTSRGSARVQKRKKSYRELSTSRSTSDSEEPSASEEDVYEIKKKQPKKGKNNSSASETKKTRAKDGRKLIDLSGRERGLRGQFGGYKQGYASKVKRPRCKTSTPVASPTGNSADATNSGTRGDN